jgi:hypothetical protein
LPVAIGNSRVLDGDRRATDSHNHGRGEEEPMIGYAMVGSSDYEKAKDFFDAVLAELGAKRTMTGDRMQG